MRIGVFGGTFSPPPKSHLTLAASAMEQLDLARVPFVPAVVLPHKRGSEGSETRHRPAMLTAAMQGIRHFEICDPEARRGGVSFTIGTLEELKRLRPDDVVHLLIGAESLGEYCSRAKRRMASAHRDPSRKGVRQACGETREPR